ncbi:hypothetical protein AYO40_01925 [Planctomycetaceae bacterium SCGC AG-212-D15]|nr:hypothetical protein AYO40_01925 [Planctomycetaceae bacterium SCGC AG-212-D15]
MIPDVELIHSFAKTRAPEVFSQIVARHGPMVLRACQRVVNNRHDAEDAAQATFLVLSQRPEAVQQNLAGWLHKVARESAQRVIRDRLRRNRREEVHAQMRSPTAREDVPELREELDAALVLLPARLREALILRYLEGHDADEAAAIAGCPPATLRWRSMEALNRLRSIFGRRQVALSIAGLTAFLALEAKATAACTASVGVLTMAAAGEATHAALVAKGVLNSFFWAKVKMAVLAGTAAATATAGGVGALLIATRPAPAQPQVVAVAPANPVQLGVNASLGGRRPFPDDSAWNEDISQAPLDPRSVELVAAIGNNTPMYPSFGANTGFPYVVVGGDQPRVPVKFEDHADESDRGPYPVPPDAPTERDGEADGTRRLLVVDRDAWKLYELYRARKQGAGWVAAGGFTFDLGSNAQRPKLWTSTLGSGLPVFPGLVRYDEVVEQQEIRHALLFSCRRTAPGFVAPARHHSREENDPRMPPMGARFRLKADFDVSPYPPNVQVILRALKKYGMFVASNGGDWYLYGTFDSRWNDAELRTLRKLRGKDFELVRLGLIESRPSKR